MVGIGRATVGTGGGGTTVGGTIGVLVGGTSGVTVGGITVRKIPSGYDVVGRID
jgi:hypothetical protein